MALARSRPRVGIGFTGPVPDIVWDIIERAHNEGLAVSSDYARCHSAEIALAASLGWISVVSLSGSTYGRIWNSTIEGLNAFATHRTTTA